MADFSKYVFGAALALGGVSSLMERAEAASITAAAFTFETSGLAFSTSVTSPVLGPLVAESGVGTASASHAALGTVYSSPAGNGSAHSFSANDYAAGDYFQFSVPLTTLQDIVVSFDSIASGTGPKVFNLQYTTDGVTYNTFTSYTLDTGTSSSFATSVSNTAVNFSFNLAGLTALNGDALAAFRLVDADTTTATAGTGRVDNFVVAGNTLATGTPEPAALSLVAIAIGGLASRRRRV